MIGVVVPLAGSRAGKCLACHRRAPCRAIHEPAHPADTGSLSAFGPLAIDFYLPSFPTLAKAFATDVEHVQLSLAAYFAGLSIGQLLYGPVADRYGRRLPLLVGVSIFTLASAACALAPSWSG